jgi:nitroreductase
MLDEAIRRRRSVRKYSDKSVPVQVIREILEAGTWAPSAKNGQQWRFTVLTGSAKRELTALFRKELEILSGKIGTAQMGSFLQLLSNNGRSTRSHNGLELERK